MKLATKIATAGLVSSVLCLLSGCSSTSPEPKPEAMKVEAVVPPSPNPSPSPARSADDAPAASGLPSPGTPLEPNADPKRLRAELNQRPSKFALGWDGTHDIGAPLWPEQADWTHIQLDSEGVVVHLGLSPELALGAAGESGEVLLTVEGPEEARALTSRVAKVWAVKPPVHESPAGGTLRCRAALEGFNLEWSDKNCFGEQGGGWLSLQVICPMRASEASFYVNLNPALKRAELRLKQPSAAVRLGHAFVEAWSKPQSSSTSTGSATPTP